MRVVDLAPFNKQQALGYFHNVFKEDISSQQKAQSIYEKLSSANKPRTPGGVKAQFVNHPFCVQMVADFVRRGLDSNFELSGNDSLVRQLLWQLCERERRRQHLTTNADAQLKALQEIAVSDEHHAFELSLCAAAGFDERDIPQLKDYPLFEVTQSDKGLYSFKYEFLTPFLRAKFLVDAFRRIATSGATREDFAWKVMAQEATSGSPVLEHIVQLMQAADVQPLAKTFAEYVRIQPRPSPEGSFLFHTTRLLIEEPNQTKRERCEKLFETLYGPSFNLSREVRHLYVSGQVDRLDVSDIAFVNCTFADVTFTDCTASDRTCFRNCVFSGSFDVGGIDQSTWRDVEITPDSILEFPTNLVWERLRGTPVAKKEEHVRDAMRLALGKFWHNGQPKLTITKNNWRTGPLGHSIYFRPIRDAMRRAGLLSEIPISGVSEGGYLFSKDRLGDLQRFMDNGQLTGAIRQVYEELLK